MFDISDFSQKNWVPWHKHRKSIFESVMAYISHACVFIAHEAILILSVLLSVSLRTFMISLHVCFNSGNLKKGDLAFQFKKTQGGFMTIIE